MAGGGEHRAAFREIANELRAGAIANARALNVRRDSPAGDVLDRQLENTLDRLAAMHGRGVFENLSPEAIFHSAIETDVAIAHARAALGDDVAGASPGRAQRLIDAGRRGAGINLRGEIPPHRPFHGAYIEPASENLLLYLQQSREPFVRWEQGVLVILQATVLESLRANGYKVEILYLDGDELLDLDAAGDKAGFAAETNRRLAQARLADDHVGDSRQHHLLRLADKQNRILRNLRDQLQLKGHSAARAAILPEIAASRTIYEAALMAAPMHRAAIRDPLAAVIVHEKKARQMAEKFAAEENVAGLREHFRIVANAPSLLAELEGIGR
jgi:hypothetical protein